jgi:hypothetical protein
MTFLILFLSSLHEPIETEQEFRCCVHPAHKKKAVTDKFTDYAADMTVLLAYFKCQDDWQDEHNLAAHIYGGELKKYCREIRERWPRQYRVIEEEIRNLTLIEQTDTTMPDNAVNCMGRLTAELFVVEEDFWSDQLRQFGYDLGRFIYLMDAAMDYQKDVKKKNYNPLILMKKTPDEMEEILSTIIGGAARQFEELPLVQDLHLLRNILYGGVWQQYYAGKSRKEKENTNG